MGLFDPVSSGKVQASIKAQALANLHKDLAAATGKPAAKTVPAVSKTVDGPPVPKNVTSYVGLKPTVSASGNVGASTGTGRDTLSGQSHIPYGQPGYNPETADPVSMGLVPTSVAKGGAGMLGKALDQIATSAIYAPAGVYDIGKAAVQDRGTLLHDVTHSPTQAETPTHLAAIGKSIVHSTAQSFEHPGRYPGYFLLNVGALASAGLSGAARLGAAADAARAGEGLAAVVKRPVSEGGSLLHKPLMPDRPFKLGTQTVHLLPSENPSMRLAQEIHDIIGRRAIANSPGGALAGHFTAQLGKALEESRRAQTDLQNVPAAELGAARKTVVGKVTSPVRRQTAQENLLAIRQVAKNVGIGDQRAFHEQQIESSRNWLADATTPEEKAAAQKTIEAHTKQIGLLQGVEARGLVGHDAAGNVVAKGPIAAAEALHHELGLATDKIVADVGLRTPDALAARVNSPGRLIAGGRYGDITEPATADTVVGQDARIAGQKAYGKVAEVHPDGTATVYYPRWSKSERVPLAQLEVKTGEGMIGGETALPGRTFVSDKQTTPGRMGSLFGTASGQVVGKARAPITSTQVWKGASELAGNIPVDPLKSSIQHFREMTRFANTDGFRRMIAGTGHAEKPEGDRWVLVNDQTNPTRFPPQVRVALGQAESTTADLAHAHTYMDFLEGIVPGLRNKFATDKAAPTGTPAPDGTRWVDRNLLGGLADSQNRLEDLSNKSAWKGTVNVNDAINNAAKTAGVYLKPGHLATRVVTNATLSLLHGGVGGITYSARLFHSLSRRERLQMGALGGQGYVHAIYDPEGTGPMAALAGKGANAWAHVDTPFRFIAVAREMRRLGFNTAAKVQDLLAHPDRYGRQLDRITKRANRENIQYDRLGHIEKEWLRRIIWFYPWVKGSTVYAGRLLYEHPLKAAGISDVGQQGEAQASKDIGPVPSIYAGMFKTGGSDAFPHTSVPSTINLLKTPADVVQTVEALAGGKYGEGAQMGADFLPPSVKAALAIWQKQSPYGDPEPTASATHILGQQFAWLPPILAYTRLRDLGYLKGLGVNPSTSKIQKAIATQMKAGQISARDAAVALQYAAAAAQAKKVRPVTGSSVWTAPVLSTAWPQLTNRAALNADAEKEMSPAEKLTYELSKMTRGQLDYAVRTKQITVGQEKQALSEGGR